MRPRVAAPVPYGTGALPWANLLCPFRAKRKDSLVGHFLFEPGVPEFKKEVPQSEH